MDVRQLRNRAKGSRDGGKPKQRPSNGLWTCSTPQQYCTGKFNVKINAQAHGSKEDCERCCKRYSNSLKGEG